MLLICFFICFLSSLMIDLTYDPDKPDISTVIISIILSSVCVVILYNNFLVSRDGVLNFEAIDALLESWWSFGYWLFKLTPELSGNWWKMLYWIICYPIYALTFLRWCINILAIYNYLFLRK